MLTYFYIIAGCGYNDLYHLNTAGCRLFKYNKITMMMLVLLTMFQFGGCATLSKDECVNADWHSIGFGDGVKGYPASRQTQHRQACAEYKVSVNLEQYLAGRDRGLEKFCTGYNGYIYGRNGSRYLGVCPSFSETIFLDGYRYGRHVHNLRDVLEKNLGKLNYIHKRLDEVHHEIEAKEKMLVSENTTRKLRRRLLNKTKELGAEEADLIDRAHRLKHRIRDLRAEIVHLETDSPFLR